VTTPKSALFGTYEQVANQLIQWTEQEGADGFIVGSSILSSGLTDFTDHVLPILKEKGYYNPEYGADTLRGHLGLSFKENRYTKQTV